MTKSDTKKNFILCAVLIFSFCSNAYAAYFPNTGDRVLTGDWDWGEGGIEIENAQSLPAACTDGQVFFSTKNTDPSGMRLYGCEGGTFVLQGNGNTNLRYDEILDATDASFLYFGTFGNTYTTSLDGTTMFSIINLDADLASETILWDFGWTANASANARPMRMRDDNSVSVEDEIELSNDGDLYAAFFRGMVANARDTDTHVTWAADNITFVAGGLEFLDITEAATDIAIFNDTSADIDFRFEGDTDPNLLFIDASTDRVGIGTSTPGETLEIDGDLFFDMNSTTETTNGVCHSGADADVAGATDRDLVVCSAGPGDIAEWYDTDGTTEAGDIVSVSDNLIEYLSPKVNAWTGELTGEMKKRRVAILQKSQKEYDSNMIGIISSSPYMNIGRAIIEEAKNPQPLALVGRVKVKVNLENGPIAAGDMITSSTTPGVGMKSSRPGMIIGRALEPLEEGEMAPGEKWKKITVLVRTQWHRRKGPDYETAKEMLGEIRKQNSLLKKEIKEFRELLSKYEGNDTVTE